MTRMWLRILLTPIISISSSFSVLVFSLPALPSQCQCSKLQVRQRVTGPTEAADATILTYIEPPDSNPMAEVGPLWPRGDKPWQPSG